MKHIHILRNRENGNISYFVSKKDTHKKNCVISFTAYPSDFKARLDELVKGKKSYKTDSCVLDIFLPYIKAKIIG